MVGAGRLATQLGTALAKAGHEVAGVYSRTAASASALGQRLECPWTTDLDALPRDAALYIVAVKDDALGEVARRVAQGREGALFVHTAGSMPMEVWRGVAPRHGVMYPMQTFSRERDVDFSPIPIYIEANGADDLKVLRRVASSLSARVREADSAQRRALHLAAVFACNFANHMYAISHHLLAEAGIPFEDMLPLIDETAAKVHALSPTEAQTGPAVRYDRGVMERHLSALGKHPEWQELYERISKSIYHDKL